MPENRRGNHVRCIFDANRGEGARAQSGWNICQLVPRGWVGPQRLLPVSVWTLTGQNLAQNDLILAKMWKIFQFFKEF